MACRTPFALLWLGLAVGCGQPTTDDTAAVPYAPADQPGPWSVATQRDALDASGPPPHVVQLWYPTPATSGAPANYDGLTLGSAQMGGPADCDTPRPVVVFSHGNGGIRYQSVFLTEHLASHGWVVVAPDHLGNTLLDLDDVPRVEVAYRRPTDAARTFDHLLDRASDPSDPLSGCVDPDAGYTIIGHSFGGFTALATAGAAVDVAGLTAHCAEQGDFLCGLEAVWAAERPDDDSGDLSDPRARAAIALAPVGNVSLGAGLGQLAAPVAVIGGLQDQATAWLTEVRPIYEQLTAEPRMLAGLDRVGHYSFSDFCIDLDDGCGDDFLPLEEAHAQIRTLTTATLQQWDGQEEAAAWLPPEWANLEWDSVVP